MLTAGYLDALPDPILALYERYQQTVLNDIARRLVKMGKVTDTAAWQMQRLSESGRIYEMALEELAQLTGQSEALLQQSFERAGVQAMRFDDSIYRAAGLNPLPLNLSPAMAQVLAAGLQKTGGIMRNLTMTTAQTAQTAFIDAADLVYMQITGGAMDYQSALRSAIKQTAGNGLSVVHYASGHRDTLDVALRRAVLTGVNQTAGQLQQTRAGEMGADLVQTSAHIGARPTHAAWQGRIFSLSGTSADYPSLAEGTGYGTGPGLCGWNCRHSFYPFFEGISENAYDRATRHEYQAKTVTYQGERMTVYDATQQQRAIERNIRRVKREMSALDAAGLDSTAEKLKVKRYQGQMRQFVNETGLPRDRFREQVYGGGRLPKVEKPLSEYDQFVADNRRSLERARDITPDVLDAGTAQGDMADYMYEFFAYDDTTGAPMFSPEKLRQTQNDLLYNVYSLGKGHMTVDRMYPVREKAAALLSGHTQTGGKVLSLKERRVLERLAAADDDIALSQIDQIRDQRLKGALAQHRYGTGGGKKRDFQSAATSDAIQYLMEHRRPGWITA